VCIVGASGKRDLAERVGFEPTERFPVHSISSAASSTTPAPLLDQPQKSTESFSHKKAQKSHRKIPLRSFDLKLSRSRLC
jgi:hypothetical protein